MKHFLGCIPPLSVVLITSAYAFAQGSTTVTTPAADLTTIITGIGTGGLTIWFCMKWVASELDRAKERETSQNQRHKDEIEKLNLDWRNKFEETERRWRHDYTNMIANRDSEKELRVQAEKDYAERIREIQHGVTNQNQMLMDSIRTMAQVQMEREKKSGNQT